MFGFAHIVLHCPTSPLLHWLVLSAEGSTPAGSITHCQVFVVSMRQDVLLKIITLENITTVYK